jgi:hypothetical protein
VIYINSRQKDEACVVERTCERNFTDISGFLYDVISHIITLEKDVFTTDTFGGVRSHLNNVYICTRCITHWHLRVRSEHIPELFVKNVVDSEKHRPTHYFLE